MSWEASDRIILAKNEEYWGEAPAIPNVIWRTIPEVATRSIEVEAGGVDIAVDIQATDIARLENSKDVKIFKNVASSINFIGLNTTMEPFNDVRVRQAINYAIDKSAIYNVVYQGTGTIAEAPMSPVVWAYNDELPQYEYNIEKAKELLAEAGYPDGFKMTMTTDESQQRQDTAEMVQSQLAEIGIEVEIRPLERTTYIGEVCAGNLEAFSWDGLPIPEIPTTHYMQASILHSMEKVETCPSTPIRRLINCLKPDVLPQIRKNEKKLT